jgi:D-alanyl-D-alanine carboxypeptidase
VGAARRQPKLWWIAGICSIALLVLAPTAVAFSPAQRDALSAAVAEDRAESGYPGLLVGVWQEGNGRFVARKGVSDLTTHRRLRKRDIFRIGSVSKTFTGTVVLQLAERGVLRLSDPVDRWVEGIENVRKVTVRDLLAQVSGFPDLDDSISDQVFLSPHRRWQVRKIVRKSLRTQPRVCPPRKCWHYSNVNYLLLGIIAENASGKPLRRLYARGILDPLGLKRTSFAPSRPVPRPRAHGYVALPGGPPVDTSAWDFSWAWSAGGFNSTLGDLRRYVPALATGEGLLSRALQRRRLRFTNVSKETTVAGSKYGLGIFQLPSPLGKFLGHNGAVPGYDSVALYSPKSKITIVALGNTSVELLPVSGSPEAPSMLFNLAPDLIRAIAQNR